MNKKFHHRSNSIAKFSNNLFKDLFPNKTSRKTNEQLLGDQRLFNEIDLIYLKQISNYVNDEKLTDLFNNNNFLINNYEQDINKLNNEKHDKKNINNITIQTDSSGYDSLGNKKRKNEDNKEIRRISIDFLNTLYNEGRVDSILSQTTLSIDKNEQDNIYYINDLKLSKNNIYVYSNTKLHPFSLFYGTKIMVWKDKKNSQLVLPAPKFINFQDLMQIPNYSKENIFNGTKIDPKKGLVVIDPNINKRYQGLVTNIIWQILKVPFGHHISLHIKIFEPRFLLERFTIIFSNINKYLIPASNPIISPIERFKKVITALISGLYLQGTQLKPFNPFLGETFQGEFPNGDKIYVEQVSHSPLAARFYLKHKNIYTFHGYFEFSVTSEGLGSTAYINQKGPIYITFHQIGEEIICHTPIAKLCNASSEKNRSNMLDGYMGFMDVKNGFRAVIKLNENKKQFDEIRGEIIKFKYPKNFKFNIEKTWEFAKKYKLKNTKNKIIATITGNYLEKLYIGQKLYWDINKDKSEYIIPVKNPLPSDGRYREDLIWLFRSFYNSRNETERKAYLDIAHEWKILMENFNRDERKRRYKLKKEKEKKAYLQIAHEWKILMENFNREERKRRYKLKKEKNKKKLIFYINV